jgi:hypothetical protein
MGYRFITVPQPYANSADCETHDAYGFGTDNQVLLRSRNVCRKIPLHGQSTRPSDSQNSRGLTSIRSATGKGAVTHETIRHLTHFS